MKAGGATTTAPGLSGGLKLGDASSSGALFKGANSSNNSNIAPSGGLKLDGNLKLNNLPLLPATTATVSKETASGVPAVGGLSSSGTALGSEGAQQSSTVGRLGWALRITGLLFGCALTKYNIVCTLCFDRNRTVLE